MCVAAMSRPRHEGESRSIYCAALCDIWRQTFFLAAVNAKVTAIGERQA